MNMANRTTFVIGCVALSIAATVSAQEVLPKTPQAGAKPQMLEGNQGERRLRRKTNNNLVAPEFLLKISPANNGSEHLVVGSEILYRAR